MSPDRVLDESCFCDRGGDAQLDLDRVFRSLAHRHRREIVCLLDEKPEWTRDALAESLLGRDHEPADGRGHPIELGLRHRHLPALERARLVSLDADGWLVRRGEHFPEVREMIEAAAAVVS